MSGVESAQGTRQLRLVRIGAQNCRSRKFASGHIKDPAREGIQSPHATAHACAVATSRRNHPISSLLYTSSVYPGQAPVWPRTPLWAFAIGPVGNRKHRRFNGRAPARITSARGSLGGQSDRCSRCHLPSPGCGSTVASSWSMLMLKRADARYGNRSVRCNDIADGGEHGRSGTSTIPFNGCAWSISPPVAEKIVRRVGSARYSWGFRSHLACSSGSPYVNHNHRPKSPEIEQQSTAPRRTETM